MIRIIYNLLWPLGLVFFLPGYLLKMFRRGGYREKFGQRLGIYSEDCTLASCEAEIDMAARRERGRSRGRAETGERAACSRTGPALRVDHDDHDRVCFGKQERLSLDRGNLHPARLLADHSPRVCGHPPCENSFN